MPDQLFREVLRHTRLINGPHREERKKKIYLFGFHLDSLALFIVAHQHYVSGQSTPKMQKAWNFS